MPEVTLEFIGELLIRLRDDVATIRDDIGDLRDSMLVQTNILLRLEHRDRNVDGDLLRLLAQVQRHEARLKALEDASHDAG